MASLLALFDTYDAAHGAAQALIAAGTPARVSYLLGGGDQAADGMEGFYPGLTPEQGRVGGARLDREDGGEDGGRPFRGLAAHRFAVTGTDSLAASPSLPERLAELGLAPPQVHRVLEEVAAGRVAAVFRFEGAESPAMELLAARGARSVERLA